jgi:hypothetical protein
MYPLKLSCTRNNRTDIVPKKFPYAGHEQEIPQSRTATSSASREQVIPILNSNALRLKVQMLASLERRVGIAV